MSWIDSEIALNQSSVIKVNYLKWSDKEVKTIEINFTEQFAKELDGYQKLQAKIPIKENNESKIWGLYVSNPIYKEILEAGKVGKTKFKILMTKGNFKGKPGNVFTIVESS